MANLRRRGQVDRIYCVNRVPVGLLNTHGSGRRVISVRALADGGWWREWDARAHRVVAPIACRVIQLIVP
eukprot:850828-Prymnesium_polylepis.1